ncbi:MAG: hypothetical protein WBD11_18295 [Xanthobacteraceae bacterium]|jgi:hypothetical protein
MINTGRLRSLRQPTMPVSLPTHRARRGSQSPGGGISIRRRCREAFREFIGQVAPAGPNAVAVIYLAGFGLQFGGENYFVPIDADIQRDVDVRCRQFAFRISPNRLRRFPAA